MSFQITRQHVVLCEGYDDRAFWQGWLLHLGCSDPSNGGRAPVKDAWDRPVQRGVYLFLNPAGNGILVQPCGGRDAALRAARFYLKDQNHKPASLVINLDSDIDLESDRGPDPRAATRGIIEEYGDSGGVEIISVIWEGDDENPHPGVPGRQTLERLAAVAIRAAYPARGPAVERWLDSEPRGDVKIPKSYAYSYLAKWYAEHGANDFYQALWRDEAVAVKLREQLEATGAWQGVAELVQGS